MHPAIKFVQRSFQIDKAVEKELPLKIGAPVNADRVIRFKASDDSLDRHQEVILPKGWNLENYIKNPVVMEFHDYWSWPLGMASAAGVMKNALWIDAEFDPPEVDENADKVFNKIQHGSIRAGSVGFIPKEIMVPSQNERSLWLDERIEELKAKGLNVNPDMVCKGIDGGFADVVVADFANDEHKGLFDKYPDARRIYTKQELLEWTICPIPANPNALAASLRTRAEKLFGAGSIDVTTAHEPDPDYTAVSEKIGKMSKGLADLAEGRKTTNKENGDEDVR